MGTKSIHPKRQHKVPKCLLRNFAVGKKKNRIWVFDKRDDKVFETTIDNVAVGNQFYNANIDEKHFASIEEGLAKLECQASPVLRQIIASRSVTSLTLTDRVKMAALIASLSLRTDGVRESIDAMDRLIEERLIREGADPSNVKLCMPGRDPAQAPSFRRMTKDEKDMMFIDVQSNIIAQYTERLATLKWVFMESASDVLYMSDHPVCMQNEIVDPMNNLGVTSRGVEVYAPLSANCCLALICPCEFDWLPNEMPLAAGVVARLNWLQVSQSSRYIFSRNRDFDFARDCLARFPAARRPVRLISN